MNKNTQQPDGREKIIRESLELEETSGDQVWPLAKQRNGAELWMYRRTMNHS